MASRAAAHRTADAVGRGPAHGGSGHDPAGAGVRVSGLRTASSRGTGRRGVLFRCRDFIRLLRLDGAAAVLRHSALELLDHPSGHGRLPPRGRHRRAGVGAHCILARALCSRRDSGESAAGVTAGDHVVRVDPVGSYRMLSAAVRSPGEGPPRTRLDSLRHRMRGRLRRIRAGQRVFHLPYCRRSLAPGPGAGIRACAGRGRNDPGPGRRAAKVAAAGLAAVVLVSAAPYVRRHNVFFPRDWQFEQRPEYQIQE